MGWFSFGSTDTNETVNTNEFFQQTQPKYDPDAIVEKPYSRPKSNTLLNQTDNETHKVKMSIREKQLNAARQMTTQKSLINRVAMETCEEFHIELEECFFKGSWVERSFKLCDPQKQKFWKCIHDQKKFLMEKSYGTVSPSEQAKILAEAQNLPTAPSL